MTPTVLIIEDNDSNRYLARYLLERHGVRTLEATNGADGLRLALETTPDLILLDIEMPEMDGYQTAAHLRASPATASVPIMAFTSYAHPRDRARALQQGFSDYLEKPFEVDEFIRRIFRLLPPASPPP